MLILIRHGESTANAADLLLGRQDAPLTERGRAQAATLGPALGQVSRVISSPLSRARDTAEALGTGLPVEVDDRWIELDYGAFDGQPLASVPDEVRTRWHSDVDYRPPGGESLREVSTRVRSACDALFSTEGEGARGAGAVVVVSHVSPIKVATCWALGIADQGVWRLYLATASITRVAWGPGRPVLHQFNETPWAPLAGVTDPNGQRRSRETA